MNKDERSAASIPLSLYGWQLKRIRELSGYSAREFGEFMARERMRPTTARGIYDLETRYAVKAKYILALRKYLGPELFDKCRRRIQEEDEERMRIREERARGMVVRR